MPRKKSALYYSPEIEGLLLTNNYCGITLIPRAVKINNKLLSRIRPFLHAFLCEIKDIPNLYIRRIIEAAGQKQQQHWFSPTFQRLYRLLQNGANIGFLWNP